MSGLTVRRLITELGFDTDEKAVQSYDKSMRNLRRTTTAVAAAATAATAALFGFAREQAARGNDIAKAASEYGIAADRLQELEFGFQRISRLSRGEVARAFERVNQSIAEARQGSDRYADGLLNVGFSQQEIADGSIDVERAFLRTAEAIRTAETRAEATGMAMDVFGRRTGRRIVGPIRESDESLEQLAARFQELGGGMDEVALQRSERFEDSMLDLRTTVTGLRDAIGSDLMPIVSDLMDDMTDWIAANRELIQQRMERAIELIRRGVEFFWRTVRAAAGVVQSFVDTLGGWETSLRILGILMASTFGARVLRDIVNIGRALLAAGVAARLLRRRIMAIPLVGLFVLATDDLWNWVKENESATGRVLGEWEDFKVALDLLLDDIINNPMQVVEAVLAAMRHLWREMALFVDGLLPDWMKSGAFDGFMGGVTGQRTPGSQAAGPPSQDVPGVGGSGRGAQMTRRIDATVQAVLNIPEGSSAAQQESMRNQAEAIVSEIWDREMRNAIGDLDPGE